MKKVWQRGIVARRRADCLTFEPRTGNGVEFTCAIPARSKRTEHFLPIDRRSDEITFDVAAMIAWRFSCTAAAAQGW